MPDPLVVPLSPFQAQRFTDLQADKQRIAAEVERAQLRISDAMTAIIAGHCDPQTLQGWEFSITGESITCTPPAE